MGIVLNCLYVLTYAGFCSSANILGIFFMPCYSHQIVVHPIYRELSLRGHNVTVLTTYPLNDPSLTNLTEIDISLLHKCNSELKEIPNNHFFEVVTYAANYFNELIVNLLEDERFKKIYHDTTRKFDVVLTEGCSGLPQAFGYKFGAPEILIFSLDPVMDVHTTMGNIIHPIVYGGTYFEIEYPISILQKLYNSYVFLWNKWNYNYRLLPMRDKTLKTYFGEDFPSLASLEKNISMAIVNKNKFMTAARPVATNLIQIEFTHIKPPRPLPQDLADIMNNSTQGVVYLSFGSTLKTTSLPRLVINEIIAGLSELPYTVLWKWESDDVPDVGRNVITRKWFPQQDILAHPNIKVFVTQGGLQSIEEAIARAVPIVGIPVIADQFANIDKIVKLGIGVKLLLSKLNPNTLRKAVIEIAENSRYQRKINAIRDISFDEPMTGLEKAVWWIEYMIRHKSAPHLKSALADIPLYEYLMLDMIAVVLGALLVAITVFRELLKLLLTKLYKSNVKTKTE